jgi:hypothetical protein
LDPTVCIHDKWQLKLLRANDREEQVNDQRESNDSDKKINHKSCCGLDLPAGPDENEHEREEAERERDKKEIHHRSNCSGGS